MVRVFWSVLIVAALSLPGVSAFACVNGVEAEVNFEVEMLSKSERLLEQGKHREALKVVMRSFPNAFTARGSFARRARTVAAVVTVRTGGQYALRADAAKVTSARVRQRNIKTAVEILRKNHARSPGNPLHTSRYAEGLAQLPAQHPRALELLEGLAKRDLLSDAEAWGVLARLRAAKGDAAGGLDAQKRCERMASNPDICVTPNG